MTAAPAGQPRIPPRIVRPGAFAPAFALAARLSLSLLLATAAAAQAAEQGARNPLRTFTPRSLALVQDATRVSETVRRLVDRLAASDLVVLVEVTDERFEYAGRTNFVTCAGGFRYVRIRVSGVMKPWDQIAVLGHELQHAVEVADAPEVAGDPTLAQLMTRIGRATRKLNYETDAAIAVTRQVEAEVRGR